MQFTFSGLLAALAVILLAVAKLFPQPYGRLTAALAELCQAIGNLLNLLNLLL